MGARQIVIARAFTIIVGMLLCAGRVLAATSDFDEANRLYEQGKFLEAARAYESIAASGAATAHVWFNLGNANYKAGHIGRAIAAYRMAERLTPRDTALRANLQFVRGRVYSDDRAHVPRWRTMVRYLTLNEWTIVTATAIWALFAVLACGEFTGRRYAKTAVVIGIIALCCGAGTALTWNIHLLCFNSATAQN
jgi:tetratricopeptide (TPR) repeat protein